MTQFRNQLKNLEENLFYLNRLILQMKLTKKKRVLRESCF